MVKQAHDQCLLLLTIALEFQDFAKLPIRSRVSEKHDVVFLLHKPGGVLLSLNRWCQNFVSCHSFACQLFGFHLPNQIFQVLELRLLFILFMVRLSKTSTLKTTDKQFGLPLHRLLHVLTLASLQGKLTGLELFELPTYVTECSRIVARGSLAPSWDAAILKRCGG